MKNLLNLAREIYSTKNPQRIIWAFEKYKSVNCKICENGYLMISGDFLPIMIKIEKKGE